jgi:hypothetical protein
MYQLCFLIYLLGSESQQQTNAVLVADQARRHDLSADFFTCERIGIVLENWLGRSFLQLESPGISPLLT